jgi:esterase
MPELSYTSRGEGRPLVVLHGLFGSGKNWQSHTRQFADRFEVINVDLRNHGQSFHADEMNYPAMAADVAQLLQGLGLRDCYILGHSMGGKVAMTLAVKYPALVARLVIADIAPVSYFHHYDDLIEPILALPLGTLASRAQADQMLRQNIPEDQLRAFLLQNLVREPDGWRWRVNWRAIQRDMEFLTGFADLPENWMIERRRREHRYYRRRRPLAACRETGAIFRAGARVPDAGLILKIYLNTPINSRVYRTSTVSNAF